MSVSGVNGVRCRHRPVVTTAADVNVSAVCILVRRKVAVANEEKTSVFESATEKHTTFSSWWMPVVAVIVIAIARFVFVHI